MSDVLPGEPAPMPEEPRRRMRRRVWWANPLSPICLLVVPTFVGAYLLGGESYLSHWKSPKVLAFDGFFRGLVAIFAFSIGAVLMMGRRVSRSAHTGWPILSQTARTSLRSVFMWMYRISVAAYIIWVLSAVQRGLRFSMLVDSLFSQNTFDGSLKKMFATVTGVTTLTQMAIAAVVIGVLLTCGHVDRGVSRRLYVLVGLAVLRGFLLAERLAIVELVLPWMVVRSAHRVAANVRPTRRLLVRLGPIVALPALLLGFSLFEYSRSWTFNRHLTNDSYVEYSMFRLLGYYVTSYNNGELYRQELPNPDRVPYYTIQFLWDAPVISSIVRYEDVTGVPAVERILDQRTNPEFNSEGGLFQPYVDFGDVGGPVYFLFAGLLVGWLYQMFVASRLVGMLLYPLFFVGLLELPRYIYWAQGRSTPSILALVGTGVLVASRSRRLIMLTQRPRTSEVR
jgi:hypothetical protein